MTVYERVALFALLIIIAGATLLNLFYTTGRIQ